MKNKKNHQNISKRTSGAQQDTIRFKNKDLEIDRILEETHFLTEKDLMEETAKKYRARPKMDEIFSNASKEVRYENRNPLDLDKEQDSVEENAVAGEKTAETMQTEIMMDNPNGAVPQVMKTSDFTEEGTSRADAVYAQDDAADEAVDEAADEAEDVLPDAELKPEYAKNTKFSDEILDDVEDIHIRNVTLTDCDSIDISIDKEQEKAQNNENEQPGEDEEAGEKDRKKAEKVRDPKQLKEEIKGNYEKLFGIKKPKTTVFVSKVPVYKDEDVVDKVHIRAGKFSEVVREEYEAYLKENGTVAQRTTKTEVSAEKSEDFSAAKKEFGEKVLSAVVGFFSSEEEQIGRDVPPEKIETVEDYTSKDDAKSIMSEINLNIRKLFMRSLGMCIIALISLVITVLVRVIPQQLNAAIVNAPVVYAVINLLLLGVSIGINRVTLVSGLSTLIRFRGNSDTALAVGSVAAALQAVVSFFFVIGADSFAVSYYSVIVIIGLLANTVGKLFMVMRVKDNFKFVSSNAPAYAAKIYTDEEVAAKMMSGTVFERPIIAYQQKTGFLTNFLKISYAPDPSEELAGKFAPVTTLISIIIAIIYGCLFKSFDGAVNALAVMTAVVVPVGALMAVNVPLRSFCKKLLKGSAMVSSYPAVKQFSDTTGIIVDANELYPEGRVVLDGIKTFIDHGAEDALIAGASILNEVQSPLAAIFDKAIDRGKGLPQVESVLYEDAMGLVGWVNSERILIGSRELMEKYNIDIPSADYEEKYRLEGKQITYISKAGQMAAMLVLRYSADPQITSELQRAEENGISILVRTTDCNVTAEKIADDFGIFYRSVKVLPTGLGNVCKEIREQTNEASRAYLATRGGLSSLVRGIAGCVRFSSNVSLSVVIQLIAIILGGLMCAMLCLYAGVQVLGTVEILLYSLFWGIAAVVAPYVKKP